MNARPNRLLHRGGLILVASLGFAPFLPSAFAASRIEDPWIIVSGRGNTLATVARDVANPAVFSFDAETGYALCARSMRIAGELIIGGEATTGSLFRHVNNLEFDIGQCGQARILLAPSEAMPPRLVVRNARIATLNTDKGNDACMSEGNLIEATGGQIVLQNSTVTGNFVVRVNQGSVDVVDSIISTSNHAGLHVASVQPAQTRFLRLRSLDHQIYGMEIGPCEGQLALEECVIRGGGADLHVRGRTELVARDCDFDSIRFAGPGGSVRRQWTVAVHTAVPGGRVVAESEAGVGLPERVEVTADPSGLARLVLTEYVARPGGQDYLRRGQNDATPHRLTVYSADGRTILHSLRNYRVLAHGQEVRIP